MIASNKIVKTPLWKLTSINQNDTEIMETVPESHHVQQILEASFIDYSCIPHIITLQIFVAVRAAIINKSATTSTYQHQLLVHLTWSV